MAMSIFADADDNTLMGIIKSASIKVDKNEIQPRILTKENVVNISNTVNALHNSINKILAHSTNIAKIHELEAKHVRRMSKERAMEATSSMAPINSSSTGTNKLTQIVVPLTKNISKLEKELKKLNLTSARMDAIPSTIDLDADVGVDVDTRRRRTRGRGRFGRGFGLAGRALGVAGLGFDIFDRATSGQSAGQIAAGVGGGAAGGFLGAQAGAALGALGGPAAPITVPLGAIIGGAAGYFGGSTAGDAAYKAVIRKQEREEKKRTQSLFSTITRNISKVAIPSTGIAGLSAIGAYAFSNKIASYLGETFNSISNYVSSVPERLANLGSGVLDFGRAMADTANDAFDIISSGGGAADMEAAIRAAGITDTTIKAQIMAQTAHESMNFTRTTEIWGPTPTQSRYEGRADLGNTRPGDGYRYRGRGFIQITGRANYEEMSRALGVDFVNNPDLLAKPEYAAVSAMAWLRKRWNRLDGKWSDTRAITKVINGGYSKLADRESKFQQYMRLYRSGQSASSGFAGAVSRGRQAVDNTIQSAGVMLTGAGRFIYPVAAVRVTSRFGPRRAPKGGASSNHGGLDFGARVPGTQGDAIFASSEGVVTFAGQAKGYGNVIYIDHPGGFQTRYAHLRAFLVSTNQRVQKGQQIGQMGNTGVSTGPHLHFEIRRNGQPINPETLLGAATVRPDATATEPGYEQKPPARPEKAPARGWFAASSWDAAISKRMRAAGVTVPLPPPAQAPTPAVVTTGTPSAKRTPPQSQASWWRSYFGG